MNQPLTKPMFSEDGERRPLLSEEELRDACLHCAATIIVAVWRNDAEMIALNPTLFRTAIFRPR
jgi:hypothetical protein